MKYTIKVYCPQYPQEHNGVASIDLMSTMHEAMDAHDAVCDCGARTGYEVERGIIVRGIDCKHNLKE